MIIRNIKYILVVFFIHQTTLSGQNDCIYLAKKVYEFAIDSENILYYKPQYSEAIEATYYIDVNGYPYVICLFKNNPTTYIYCGVPKYKWDNYIKSKSAGNGFNQFISAYKCSCINRNNSLDNNLLNQYLKHKQDTYDRNRLRLDLIMYQINALTKLIMDNPEGYNYDNAYLIVSNYSNYYQRLANYDLSKPDRNNLAYSWFHNHLIALELTKNDFVGFSKSDLNSILVPLPLINDTQYNR